MAMNENIHGGYSADPAVFYGPSAQGLVLERKLTEPGTLDDAPIAGPVTPGEQYAGGRALPSVGAFLKSPAGLLVILLAVGYVAFHQVFS